MIDPVEESLIRAYVEAYNRFDIEGMLATLADGVHFEHHAGGALAVATDGKAEFEKLARVGAAMFASRRQTLVSLEEQEGRVAATLDFHGEIAEDIPEGPRAGTVIEMRGTSAFGFDDGRIALVIDRA
ncbi:nuclear transport factor 2 family protein [Luteibacter sp. CQ10]|uniref:nuclear transport factor 2 family protein n=1 Tax=Luteibacter sp. CQ10 TaxID=2805821 RepID=UPI0034A23AB0